MGEWITPKRFLRGRRLNVGDILDPDKLGMEPHPIHGKLPVLIVTQVHDNCSLQRGKIHCGTEGCPEYREIAAADWHQVRRCVHHQKIHEKKSHKKGPPIDIVLRKARWRKEQQQRYEIQEAEHKKREAERAALEAAEQAKRDKAIASERKRQLKEEMKKRGIKIVREEEE